MDIFMLFPQSFISDSFEKVDFNINVHGDYKFYENFSRLLTAAELFTGNLNNFRGIFNWTSLIEQTTVIVLRDHLALSSQSRNPDFNVHGDYKFYEHFEIFEILKF
jgi:hypothetical protein